MGSSISAHLMSLSLPRQYNRPNDHLQARVGVTVRSGGMPPTAEQTGVVERRRVSGAPPLSTEWISDPTILSMAPSGALGWRARHTGVPCLVIIKYPYSTPKPCMK